MAAQYRLDPRFRAALSRGRLRFILRDPADRRDQAEPGDGLTLSTTGDGAGVRRDALCIYRARVVLDAAGVVRVLEGRTDARRLGAHLEAGEGFGRLLHNAEQGAATRAQAEAMLARAGGFASMAALFRWYAGNRRRGAGRDGRMTLELIAWVLL